MSRLNIRLKSPTTGLLDYSLLIRYYEQIQDEDAKGKFVETLQLFWNPMRVWYYEESNAEKIIRTARQEILCHQQRTLAKWSDEGLKTLPFSKKTVSNSKQWEFRLQPQKTSPIGTLLMYLKKELPGYSEERKYWMPNYAWWGAIAAEQMGREEAEVQVIAYSCASLLADHAHLLTEVCLTPMTTKNESISINQKIGGDNLESETKQPLLVNPNEQAKVEALWAGIGEFS